MKTYRQLLIMAIASLAVMLLATPGFAQSDTQQAQPQTDGQQPPKNQDPLQQLDLTPEQRQQIRAAMESTKADRSAANIRLRQAQAAYEEALEADNPSESVIEERAREVGAAQAALMRARATLELRIRRILTPDQRARLKNLRLAQRERRLEQQRQNQANGPRPMLPNRRNALGPGQQMKRNNLRKNGIRP